ncbi:MAG: hypothetical protein ABI687_03470 [Flavitalea sp.]
MKFQSALPDRKEKQYVFFLQKHIPGFKILLAGTLALLMLLPKPSSAQSPILEKFSIDNEHNILEEDDFGIINGHLTERVNYLDVAGISGLYAPPFASSDFLMEVRFFGEKIASKGYKWYPIEVKRHGTLHGVNASTSTVLASGQRATLITITLENKTKENKIIPIQVNVKGGFDYVPSWNFARPEATKTAVAVATANRLVKANDAGAIVIGTDIPGLSWFDLAYHWDTRITLAAGTSKTYHIALAIGADKEQPEAVCAQLLKDPQKVIADARKDYTAQLTDMFAKLPTFTASDKRLEAYYNKSLLHLLINKWDVPEFFLHPYYGTGSVIGGCVANYLWDFGIPSELLPLYDPKASKEHIKHFLKLDITKHFLFDPMTGNADGPWYPVNQDKMIELIYFYVMNTGDIAFLQEKVSDTTILDHAIKNAMFGDNGAGKPVNLVDYTEEGEHHLELRRKYPYHGIMPDLNGRRYLSYIRVYELTQMAGSPVAYLPQRAEGLKKILKDSLWSAKDKWFYFDINGKKDLRWTNIMYMLMASPVLDQEQREGMVSHLNTKEFLSDYGIHSISKIDRAFDQVDIDHGGGGSYVAFPSMIAQQLWNTGYQKAADDLIQRHLWLAERLPYWGDSHVANFIGYRFDTPLQSAFDATAGAQSIIYGIFGVKIDVEGNITVNPHTPSFSPSVSLKGFKIRGSIINISANLVDFTVEVNGKLYKSKIGQPVVVALGKGK